MKNFTFCAVDNSRKNDSYKFSSQGRSVCLNREANRKNARHILK